MPYRQMDADTLEREYSPSSMTGGDYSSYLEVYTERSETARRELRLQEDLAYGTGPRQVLDYFPAGIDPPLHVFIHGGYWQELSRKESAIMAAALVKHGVACAVIDYTIAPHGTLPAMVRECRDAVDWLYDHAHVLDFNRDRISVSGHSAGAHLAAMLLGDGEDWPPVVHGRLAAAILVSGIYDLEPIRRTSINDPLRLDREDVAMFSPLGRSPRVACPVHVLVADQDTAEFRRQSRDYAAHLSARGIDATFGEIPARNHFDIILDLFDHRTARGRAMLRLVGAEI